MPGVRTVKSLDCLVLSNLIKQSYITTRKHSVALFHAASLLSSTWFTKNQFCIFEHLVQISKEEFSWKYVSVKSYSNIHIKQERYSNAYILNINHESWSWNDILSGGKISGRNLVALTYWPFIGSQMVLAGCRFVTNTGNLQEKGNVQVVFVA